MSEIGSGSGSSYPSTKDTNNSLEINSPNTGKTKARAEVPNDLAACVVAIETELGVDPAGSLTDVKTFLQTEHTTDGTHGAVTADSIEMQSGQLQLSKGNDVVSANALPILTDGNIFDVTGTTNITSIDSVGVGTVIKLHFDGVVLISHDATNLILPDGLDITTSAGDEFEFYEYASGDWRLTTSSRQQANLIGNNVQMVYSNVTAVYSGSTAMSYDDVIPTSSEGNAFSNALDKAITPVSTSNLLIIDVIAVLSWGATTGVLTLALYQDAGANAIKAVSQFPTGAGQGTTTLTLRHIMTAGTTSATTFKIRAGGTSAILTTLNGESGSRKHGGVSGSNITITEIKA